MGIILIATFQTDVVELMSQANEAEDFYIAYYIVFHIISHFPFRLQLFLFLQTRLYFFSCYRL